MRGAWQRNERKGATAKLHVCFPYYQQIWWDALNDLRNQLADHCLTSKPDKLRFQEGRLLRISRAELKQREKIDSKR